MIFVSYLQQTRLSINRGIGEGKTTYQTNPNYNIHDIHKHQEDLPGRRKQLPPVQEHPEDAAQAKGEPTGEQRGDETEKAAEDGDSLGDDPSDDPKAEGDSYP